MKVFQLRAVAGLLAGFVLCGLCSVDARERRRREPRGGFVADCADTDPENYDDVWRCVSSYRDRRSGKNGFESGFSRAVTACFDFQTKYAAALRASGIKNANASLPETRALIPSCEMAAKVRADWTGEPSAWADCLNFAPETLETHMTACLTSWLRGYKGRGQDDFTPRDAARFLPDCEAALNAYEQALKASHEGRKPPPEYVPPSCDLVASVLSGMMSPVAVAGGEQPAVDPLWGACLGYTPETPEDAPEHIERCMEGYTRGVRDCADLIARYETRLRSAYGGSFPVGYVRPKCFDAADTVEAERIAAAERQRQHEEQRRQIEAAKLDRARKLAEQRKITFKKVIIVVKKAGQTGAAIVWNGIKKLWKRN